MLPDFGNCCPLATVQNIAKKRPDTNTASALRMTPPVIVGRSVSVGLHLLEFGLEGARECRREHWRPKVMRYGYCLQSGQYVLLYIVDSRVLCQSTSGRHNSRNTGADRQPRTSPITSRSGYDSRKKSRGSRTPACSSSPEHCRAPSSPNSSR